MQGLDPEGAFEHVSPSGLRQLRLHFTFFGSLETCIFFTFRSGLKYQMRIKIRHCNCHMAQEKEIERRSVGITHVASVCNRLHQAIDSYPQSHSALATRFRLIVLIGGLGVAWTSLSLHMTAP